MRNNLGTIPMIQNAEGVFVMDRNAARGINPCGEEELSRGPVSAVSFFKRFDEILDIIEKEGSKRRYYTQ